MEMGEEIRPFQEKGRRGAQRHPFGVGWWCMAGTRVLRLGGQRRGAEAGGAGSSLGDGAAGGAGRPRRIAQGSRQPPFAEMR